MKYSEFYLEQLSYTDAEPGEAAYLSDGMYVLPDGSIVEEDSKEYKQFYLKSYKNERTV